METIKINDDVYTANTIYYISPNGDDSNDGSKSAPFLTYKQAYNACSDGDAICFLSGTHNFDNKDLIDTSYVSSRAYRSALFCNKEIVIYSESLKKTIININHNYNTGRISLFYFIEGATITNLNIFYYSARNANNNYENTIFSSISKSRGELKNCIINFSSAGKIALVYDNDRFEQKVYNCTFSNNGEWFSSNYSGKVTLENCVYNSILSSGATITMTNCLQVSDLSEVNLYKKYMVDDIRVGAIYISAYYILNNGNFYSASETYYDTKTSLYTPLSNLENDIPNCDDLCDTPNYLNGLRPIDLFEGDIQLIYIGDTNFTINGIKSNKELIVATGDINKGLAETINSITVESTKINNGNLKLAVSIDNGKTWKTYDGANWVDLLITIPSTEYSSMTVDERFQWNEARDVILSDGITINAFNSIDFNTLTDDNTAPEYLRFAYVLNRPAYADDIKTTKLNWDFDAKGNMDLMIPGTEYTLSLFEKEVRFTSLIDNDLIKINFLI